MNKFEREWLFEEEYKRVFFPKYCTPEFIEIVRKGMEPKSKKDIEEELKNKFHNPLLLMGLEV